MSLDISKHVWIIYIYIYIYIYICVCVCVCVCVCNTTFLNQYFRNLIVRENKELNIESYVLQYWI
jgi:hypothetical protein